MTDAPQLVLPGGGVRGGVRGGSRGRRSGAEVGGSPGCRQMTPNMPPAFVHSHLQALHTTLVDAPRSETARRPSRGPRLATETRSP